MSYHGVNSCIFVNGVETYKFKQKHSEINAAMLCLVNILTDFVDDNLKKTGLYVYVYEFSVDYDADEILDMHKYSIKKNGIE